MFGKHWTDEEIEFLKTNYGKLGIQDCASSLKRSKQSISMKASRLGLTGRLHQPSDKYGKHRKGISPVNKLTDEFLIERILDVAYLLDRPPQAHEMWELCRMADKIFTRAFGSWNKALKAAGLPPAPPKKYCPPSPPPVQCKTCGAIIEEPKWASRCFCDLKCFGTWVSEYMVGENGSNWRGGYEDYYGPNWNSQRRKARKRDQYICQRCGITEQEIDRELDVHHITPFRKYGLERHKEANRLNNLISLCPNCHQQSEGKLITINSRTRPTSASPRPYCLLTRGSS